MMFDKKTVFSLLFLALGSSMQDVVASQLQFDGSRIQEGVVPKQDPLAHLRLYDVRDSFGRTELMNWIRDQESKISFMRSDLAALHRNCYYVIYHRKGLPIYIKKSEYSKEVIAYEEVFQKLRKLIREINLDVAERIKQGANLNAQDNAGQTVLNYCKSKEIYSILRAHGASFRFDAWLYVHQAEIAFASLITTVTGLALHQEGILTADNISAFVKDVPENCAILASQAQEVLTPIINNAGQVIQGGYELACKDFAEADSKSFLLGLITVPYAAILAASVYAIFGRSTDRSGDDTVFNTYY